MQVDNTFRALVEDDEIKAIYIASHGDPQTIFDQLDKEHPEFSNRVTEDFVSHEWWMLDGTGSFIRCHPLDVVQPDKVYYAVSVLYLLPEEA